MLGWLRVHVASVLSALSRDTNRGRSLFDPVDKERRHVPFLKLWVCKEIYLLSCSYRSSSIKIHHSNFMLVSPLDTNASAAYKGFLPLSMQRLAFHLPIISVFECHASTTFILCSFPFRLPPRTLPTQTLPYFLCLFIILLFIELC